jgi:hypothetical protein
MAQLDGVPVTWQLGGHDLASFTSADLVVMSPGVPTLPEMVAARAAGVEVIAEIELAYRCLHPEARCWRSPAPTASRPPPRWPARCARPRGGPASAAATSATCR